MSDTATPADESATELSLLDVLRKVVDVLAQRLGNDHAPIVAALDKADPNVDTGDADADDAPAADAPVDPTVPAAGV
jgi:hypothetical protein